MRGAEAAKRLGAIAVMAALPATAAAGTVAGTIYVDNAPRDGVLTEADLPLAGYVVEVAAAGSPNVAIGSTVSNGDGEFSLGNVDPGSYRLRVSSPSGVELAETADFSVDGDELRRDVRVDPTGRIYDATTGAPVAGVRLKMELEAGGLVPAGDVGPGQQGQVTSADGIYRFDLLPNRRYRMVVDTSAASYAAPSTLILPADGFAPTGAVVDAPLPSIDGPTTYYLRFDVTDAQYAVLNNHVPVDPLTERVQLAKRADRPAASVGDIVGYTITATNRSSRDLDGVFLDDSPDRGLTYLKGQVVASVGEMNVAAVDPSESFGSRRLIRFGPFDVPAGATLAVTYQTAIGVDARPGSYDNRARLVDGAGVRLSNDAEATVRVEPDGIFDEALIAGRVFCDDDGDGRLDDTETGLMGARVFIDTGSYATTDSAGLYHLSQIGPGTHMVKLDVDSLAGGTAVGDVHQVVHLTRGLPVSVAFSVLCARETVARDDPRITVRIATRAGVNEPPAKRYNVTGSVRTLQVAVDGVRLPLPTATVMELDDRFVLGHSAPGGVAAVQWVMAVNRHERGGEFVDIARKWEGVGAPPRRLDFDGTDGAGTDLGPGLYSAQLVVAFEGHNLLAVSRRVPFAVQSRETVGGPISEVWRGNLFGGGAREPTTTLQLSERVRGLAERLGPRDTVAIEVHFDGTGDRLETTARTQREATLIRKLFIEGGATGDRVTARGRGSMEPLGEPNSAKARRQNRRVVIEVRSGAYTEEPIRVPRELLVGGEVKASVNGQPVAVDDKGRFETASELPICVEVHAADGRLAMVCASQLPTGATTREVAVRGDFATGTVFIDGEPAEHRLVSVAATLSDPSAPLVFALGAPRDLVLQAWRFEVRADDGTVVHEHSAKGAPPERYSFDATNLAAGTRYAYALEVEVNDGEMGSSEPMTFVFDPPGAADLLPTLSKTGRFFARRNRVRAGLKNHLSRVATALDADERYVLSLQVGVGTDASVAEQRLSVVAKSYAVKKYLEKLRVPAHRYELQSEPIPGGKDSLTVGIARPVAPQVPIAIPPAAAINGADQPLRGNELDATVTMPADQPLVLEVTLINGQRARFVIAAPPTPALAPEPPPTPESTRSPRDVLAADLQLVLPYSNVELGAPLVPVHGNTARGNTIAINGAPIHVSSDGRFHALVQVKAGNQKLVIVSRDRAGNEAEIAWPVRVSQSSTFSMAMVEGVAMSSWDPDHGWSTRDAWLDGMTEESTATIGPMRLHGRVAGYAKARFRNFNITAHVDTAAREQAEGFFENVVDPEHSYAVFGDSASETRDVNARGTLYLHVDDGADKNATLGNIRGHLRGGELFRFDRTVYGAQLDFGNMRWRDDHSLDVVAVTSFEQTGLSRDINLFRATGGSLYYLRNSGIAEGSEQIRIVVRDRDSGLLLSERVVQRNQDYAIDYPAGRLLFHEPVASTAESGWLLDNLDSAAGPLGGHPVYIEVQYEHEFDGTEGSPTGVYIRDTIDDKLAVGAGVVSEGRDGQDYRLWGGDVSYTIDDESRVWAEVGASKSVDGANFVSSDGGLSFGSIGTATEDYSYAWKAGARIALDGATTASLHAQSLERGFSSGATVLEQGLTKFGGVVSHTLNATDVVAVRHDSDIAELDDRIRARAVVQWRRKTDPWIVAVEGGHHYVASDIDTADANRVGVGGRIGRRLDDRITVRVGQQVQSALSEDDPQIDDFAAGVTTHAGGDVELAPDLVVSADEYLRWNGDNATRVGLRTKLGDGGSVYVREQFGTRDGDFVATTIVGASDRFGPNKAGKTYGEYQLENSVAGPRNRAILGLGHRWRVARGVRASVGYEHQQTFGGFTPEGEPLGDRLRDVVHARAELVRFDHLKASARAELRWDDTATTETLQIVSGLGVDVKLTRDVTVLGRLRVLHTEDYSNQKLRVQTEDDPDSFKTAGRVDAIAGWVYRPIGADWIDVFAQYAYQVEQRPATEVNGSPETRSHVGSVAPMATLPLRLSLSSKLAWKKTRQFTSDPASGAGGAGGLVAQTDALLWLLRLAYRFYGKWDAAVEYRQLYLWRDHGAAQAKHGVLLETAYTLGGRVRLGLGYNFSRFSDNELGDLERDSHGLFLRLVGTY